MSQLWPADGCDAKELQSMNGYVRHFALITLLLITQPSWVLAECNDAIPRSKPDSRYVDHNNGTITDKVTGLMWKQCPEGMSSREGRCDSGQATTFTWQQALQWANEVNSGNSAANLGYGDWRLPTLLELKSLAEIACYNPAINTQFFPNTPTHYFWSSTPVVSIEDKVWGVAFYYGGDRWASKDGTNFVRLVRNTK